MAKKEVKKEKKPEKKVYLTKLQVEDILKTLKGIQEEKIENRETKERDPYKVEITKEDLKRAEFTLGKSKLLDIIDQEIKQGEKPNLESITTEAERNVKEEDKKKDEYKKDKYGEKSLYSDEVGLYNDKAKAIPNYDMRKEEDRNRHSTT